MVVMIILTFGQFIFCVKKPPPIPEGPNAGPNKKNQDKFASWYVQRSKELTEYHPAPQEMTMKIWESGPRRLVVIEWPDIFSVLSIVNYMLSIGLSIYSAFFASQITEFTSDKYVDLLAHFETVQMIKYVNCVNIFLMSLSVFNIISRTFNTLRNMSSFMIKITWPIMSLFYFLLCYVFMFSFAFWIFYDKRVARLSSLESVIVSVFSLSLGNVFLNEDIDVVNNMNPLLYWGLMIVEYVCIYIIMLNIIYVLIGNYFLQKTDRVAAGETGKEGVDK